MTSGADGCVFVIGLGLTAIVHLLALVLLKRRSLILLKSWPNRSEQLLIIGSLGSIILIIQNTTSANCAYGVILLGAFCLSALYRYAQWYTNWRLLFAVVCLCFGWNRLGSFPLSFFLISLGVCFLIVDLFLLLKFLVHKMGQDYS